MPYIRNPLRDPRVFVSSPIVAAIVRNLRWVAAAALALLAVCLLIASVVGVVQTILSKEEPGGRARVHSPFLDETCDSARPPRCVNDVPTVKFDLAGDETDEVADDRLYRRARREGAFFIEIRWVSHEVARVRENGEWRQVAHPRDANLLYVLVIMAVAVGLFVLALVAAPSGPAERNEGTG